ncbi:MAG: hypothetical protein J5896_06440 [Alphaproteobacteria bacterium]|nr:hypothetical protein [Alphaproteobacteria bacterium]
MTIISESSADFALPLFVGTNKNSKDVFVNFSLIPHLLLLGDSGTGKTHLMNNMIVSLAQKFSPKECKIVLIDTTLLEFYAFENMKHLLGAKITNTEGAISKLQELETEIQKRYDTLQKANCRNIEQYNATSAQKMPYIVCFIEEIAELMTTFPEQFTELVKSIYIKGIAAGVHLILATKEIMPEVLSPSIRILFKNLVIFNMSAGKSDIDYLEAYLDGIEPWKFEKLGQHALKLEYGVPEVLNGKFMSESALEEEIEAINRKLEKNHD